MGQISLYEMKNGTINMRSQNELRVSWMDISNDFEKLESVNRPRPSEKLQTLRVRFMDDNRRACVFRQ